MLHRNTYIHSPAHLDRFWRMRREPRIFFAGQITGVEGYVESAATGLSVGLTIAQLLEGREPVPAPLHDGDRLARPPLLGASGRRSPSSR